MVLPFFEPITLSDSVVSRRTPWTHTHQFITSVSTGKCYIPLFLLENIPKIPYLNVVEKGDVNIHTWRSFLNVFLGKERDGLAKKASNNQLEEYPSIYMGIFVWDNDFTVLGMLYDRGLVIL